MTITTRPRWSLGRGKPLVPSGWQATADVRRATSPWHQIPASASERAVERLRVEIEDGSWDRRYGHLRGLDSLDVGLRLVIAD